eukprot:scaffold6369_cov113-Isochrysis_galbana.AAC.12
MTPVSAIGYNAMRPRARLLGAREVQPCAQNMAVQRVPAGGQVPLNNLPLGEGAKSKSARG